MRRLAGLPPGAGAMLLESFLRVVHKSDRGRVRREFGRGLGEGSEIDTEFRVIWPSGSVR